MAIRRFASIATTVTVVAGVLAAVAPAMTAVSPKKITALGAGEVTLGSTYTSLRKHRLIGKIGPGCESAGPGTRSAPLRAPLQGGVNFTLHSPRKVAQISITGPGAVARGVGIGASSADIKAAFPQAKVDHSTDTTFQLTLVSVPKGAGGRIAFGVDTKTERVTVIGIPVIAFCE